MPTRATQHYLASRPTVLGESKPENPQEPLSTEVQPILYRSSGYLDDHLESVRALLRVSHGEIDANFKVSSTKQGKALR